METRRYSDIEILELLQRLDTGERLSEEEMRALRGRKSLDLSVTNITELPSSIANLNNLEILRLKYTNLDKVPECIGQLKKLKTLDLFDTLIWRLPDSICHLTNLRVLDLRNTLIVTLPESIGNISNLQVLSLGGTRMDILPESIKRITSLESLGISNTDITAIPNWLGEMPNLRHLNMMGLILPSIPVSLTRRNLTFLNKTNFHVREDGINLYGVTLTEQDISIFLEHPELIPSLYNDQITLRECKVIFLGDGELGKSYTIARFLNEGRKETPRTPYVTRETPGVEIKDYHVKKEDFDIHFWDFGGQQLLHAMHRCFLTEETCYVVTVKSRETRANQRARYWLRNVKAFAPNSPVFLYVNCWDNDDGRRSIDENRLRADFPNIQEVVYCSAKNAETEEFRRTFMDRLIELAANSEGCTRTINARWDALQREIRKKQETNNILTKGEYFALCRKHGIENGNEAGILTFFNNLGICFSYHRDRERRVLLDYRLLKPVWLTNALYAVIEEGRASAQEGRIPIAAIEQMLTNNAPERVKGHDYRRTAPEIRYESAHIPYILDVAAAHELCYAIDGDKVFFPALCGTDSPMLPREADFPQHIAYRLKYSYLPDSVVHRLMIRCLRRKLTLSHAWLRGMVLDGMDDRCRAVVRMNDDDEALDIDVYSRDDPAFDLFSLLRAELQSINDALGLTANEFIMDRADAYPLPMLLSAHRDNSKVYSPSGETRDPAVLLGSALTEWDLHNLEVRGGTIVLNIPKREYHRRDKSDEALRHALYKVYDRTCPYCKKPFLNFKEFEVDHILPAKWKPTPELQPYLDYIEETGFNLGHPDYIENYFPAHSSCNREKTNDMNIFTLPCRHEVAARRVKRVLDEIKKYKGEK